MRYLPSISQFAVPTKMTQHPKLTLCPNIKLRHLSMSVQQHQTMLEFKRFRFTTVPTKAQPFNCGIRTIVLRSCLTSPHPTEMVFINFILGPLTSVVMTTGQRNYSPDR